MLRFNERFKNKYNLNTKRCSTSELFLRNIKMVAEVQTWSSMKELKPIDPESFNGIDYGFVVEVLEGENKGKMGLAVMFSRLGDVGVKPDFPEEPCFLNGYEFRENPENLKVLSRFPLTRLEAEVLQTRPIDWQQFRVPVTRLDPPFRAGQGVAATASLFGQRVAFGEVRDLVITHEEKEREIYAGSALGIDHLEHGITFDINWIAHPFRNVIQVQGRNYAFKVRPQKRDEIFFGWNFTLSGSFNQMIEDYIMSSILAYNPSIKGLNKD
jgi:hypothetical protein